MSPEALLVEARRLLESDDLGGAAARGAALLIRQALEHAVWAQVRAAALELREDAPFTVVLLCLQRVSPEAGARAAATWSGLSRACHAHGYELPPAPEVLLGWLAEVELLVRSRPA